jgi:predicted small integral membrane protein
MTPPTMVVQAQRRIFQEEARRKTLRFIARKEIISRQLNLKPGFLIWFFSLLVVLGRIFSGFPSSW